MTQTSRHDAWSAGDSYETYMGRWSRRIAPRFLDWIDLPGGLDWFEVGCGTGALSAAIVERCNPKSLTSIDPSAGFLQTARTQVADRRVDFHIGDAQEIAAASGSRDAVVSALVLNFVPDRARALAEMKRIGRKGATVGFYVWDYPGGGIEFMRAFWTAASALDPSALELTEGRRFPFCTDAALTDLARSAGLADVRSAVIESETLFRDFDDFWLPFTLGVGPAPGYCMSLLPESRERLRTMLKDTLPQRPDGSISLTARAWAIRATVP